MKTNRKWMAGVILSLCVARAAVAAQTTASNPLDRVVSLQSLLEEMIDREAVAKWPAPAYSCKQASSHDRRKKDPADSEGWHSNVDYGQFIRTEVNDGRHEWVIMEDQGPGTIARFWIPLNGEKDKQVIRFYFDGSATPAIAVKLNELLSGKSFVTPPFAFVAWNETDLLSQKSPGFKAPRGVAGDLYLPIPFAKGCKVTLDEVPFYYVINYRLYEPGTRVETFSMAGYDAAKPAIERVGAALLERHDEAAGGADKQARLAGDDELTLDLPQGPSSVRSLMGEFFGSGARLRPVHDWWRTVNENGTLMARWVMPYQRQGRLSLKNFSPKPVSLKLSAATGPWTWNERSLYFHANWRGQSDLKTRPYSDWNYLDIQGRGVYVGDTLTVFSPVAPWYGEGDERIFIDGENVASHIGTGTEDYYGYAWGMAGFFNSPFISMPQRDASGQGNWRGYTTTSRVRLLDGIPWRTRLQHNMEIWNWADTRVDYAVGTFYYAGPQAKHNRLPQPDEVARPLRETPPDPAQFRIQGAIECEKMTIAAKSPDLRIGTQDAGLKEGMWSGGNQLFVQATRVGDFVELAVPAACAQPRKVTIYATKSYDYGILRFTINGQPAGKDYDAYASEPVASGPIELGTFAPKDGKLLLRVEVVGTNPAANGTRHFFGLDCIVLQPR
ncbi:MAG: DUF2961 domain-containing protein [Verrucomicrobia bacterium]|nr:DUF2961 domain-containing protein [Verrucomicrobiota bacterium]